MTSFRPSSAKVEAFREVVSRWNRTASLFLHSASETADQIRDPSNPNGLLSVSREVSPGGAMEDWPTGRSSRGEREALPSALRIGRLADPQGDENRRGLPTRPTTPTLVDFVSGRNIIIDADLVPDEVAKTLMRNLVVRIMNSLRGDRFELFLALPKQSGATFAGLPGVETGSHGLPNVQVLGDEKDFSTLLKSMELEVTRVTVDHLKDSHGNLREYLTGQPDSAERFRFILVDGRDFVPDRKTLESVMILMRDGPRAGIQLALLVGSSFWGDPEQQGVDPPDLQTASRLTYSDESGQGVPILGMDHESGHSWQAPFEPDPPPEPLLIQQLTELVAEECEPKPQPPIPLDGILPDSVPAESSLDGLRAQVGFQLTDDGREAGDQSFEIGDAPIGGMIGGRSGSGKSNLLHVLINSLCAHYPPEELQLVLLDFKGAEFEEYSGHRDGSPLPQLKILATQSDPEFGLAVVDHLVEQVAERNEIFKQYGVQDLAGYRSGTGQPMPRILAIMDEYQKMFQDQRIGTEAADKVAKLAREGRSTGVHLVLATQTFSGMQVYNRHSEIEKQLSMRLVCACDREDSERFLGDASASLLPPQGEAVFTEDRNGPRRDRFRIPLAGKVLRDERRHRLSGWFPDEDPPFTFSGAGSPPLVENRAFAEHGRGNHAQDSSVALWLGQPLRVDDPVEIRFERKPASHLALVGSDPDSAHGVVQAAVLASARQLGGRLTVHCLLQEPGTLDDPFGWGDLGDHIRSLGATFAPIDEAGFIELLNDRVGASTESDDREILVGMNLEMLRDALSPKMAEAISDPSLGKRGLHLILWWSIAQYFTDLCRDPKRIFSNILCLKGSIDALSVKLPSASRVDLGDNRAWLYTPMDQTKLIPYTRRSVDQYMATNATGASRD